MREWVEGLQVLLRSKSNGYANSLTPFLLVPAAAPLTPRQLAADGPHLTLKARCF